MTMPIQVDTAAYIKILEDAGVPLEHASAHAVALASEIRMKQWVRDQLKPIYWLQGLILVLQTITMTKLFL